MYQVIIDCDLMRFRDSGLYHYCLNLGKYANRISVEKGECTMAFYVPEAEKNAFDSGTNCIIEKKWHHHFFKPFLWNCDVWHAPFQSGRILPASGSKTKIVLTIHDLNCLHEGKSRTEKAASLRKTQLLIDRSDALVCISNHCKKDVLTNLDVGNKPVYVIHNGTHHVPESPSKPQGYHPHRPFIYAMGYVNRKKNFHTLIALLQDETIELLIAGKLDEPEYVQHIRDQANEAGVLHRLNILGPVSEVDKAWYLQHCMAFMMPSLAEGFGAPVVEAMAFGKPLFLSNLTSLPEIGGDVAFYFNDFDEVHMRNIFKQGLQTFQKENWAPLVLQRSNEFNWEIKAKEYLDVYRSLV